MTRRRTSVQQRARYARTNGNLLMNAPIGRGVPSGQEPVVWWWDSDTRIATGQHASLAAVTRATSLIVNSLTTAPWRMFVGSPDPRLAVIELPPPRWLIDPMLVRADERYGASPVAAALRMPRAAFWAQWIRACLLKGMGYLLFQEGADGAPIPGTMRVLNPDFITPVDQPYIHRRIGSEESGAWVETDWEGRVILGNTTYRLIELNNPLAQADVFGVTPGVLEMHALELGLAERSAAYGQNMMTSGIPSGFLKVGTTQFTKAQAEQLRADWMEHHGGDQRSIAVLNASVDFSPISMSPVDIALIETRKMSLLDVSNAFGVPVYLLGGDTGGLNYTNAESRSLDLKTFTLLQWGNAAEDRLSALLPQNQWVEVDWRGLTRADTKTRYDSYEVALRAGFFTIDEVRRLEGLPPLPESVVSDISNQPPGITPGEEQQAIEPAPEEEPA